MTVLSDQQILDEVHIEPKQQSQCGEGVVSFGVSSYGYDVRVGTRFKIFTNTTSGGVAIVDPKRTVTAYHPRNTQIVESVRAHAVDDDVSMSADTVVFVDDHVWYNTGVLHGSDSDDSKSVPAIGLDDDEADDGADAAAVFACSVLVAAYAGLNACLLGLLRALLHRRLVLLFQPLRDAGVEAEGHLGPGPGEGGAAVQQGAGRQLLVQRAELLPRHVQNAVRQHQRRRGQRRRALRGGHAVDRGSAARGWPHPPSTL